MKHLNFIVNRICANTPPRRSKRASRFVWVLVLMLTLGVGQMWGADQLAYSITYVRGANDSGTTNAAIEDGSDYASLGSLTKAYQRTNGMHLSSGSANGSATLTMTTTGQVVATKIVTNALAKSSKSFTITVNYVGGGSENKNFTPGTTTTDCVFTLTNSDKKKISSIVYTANSGSGAGIASTSVYVAASCTNPSTLLSISSSNTATLGTDKTLTTSGGNNGTVTWTVANGTGSATVSGNTLHPTSAGTVTVTATQDDNNGKCGKVVNQTITISKASATITLSELGATSSVSGTHYGGDSYTLPTSTDATCTGKKLVGWSRVEIEETDIKPTSNFYAKGETVTLTAGTNTFYALFAAGDGGTLTVTRSDVSTSGTGYAECTWTVGTINGKVNLYKNTTSYIQIGGSNLPHPYNSTELPAAISKITITMPNSGTCRTWTPRVSATAAQSTASSTSGTNLTGKTFSSTGTSLVWDVDTDEDYRYFYLSSGGNTNIASFEIEYGTYTKYATSCCTELGQINGSFSRTNLLILLSLFFVNFILTMSMFISLPFQVPSAGTVF